MHACMHACMHTKASKALSPSRRHWRTGHGDAGEDADARTDGDVAADEALGREDQVGRVGAAC